MNVSEHTARVFDTDLIKLTQLVAQMGGLAQKEVTDFIDALIGATLGSRGKSLPQMRASTRCSARSKKKRLRRSRCASPWRSICVRW